MNELQKKLARRRSLNGELGVAPVGAEPLVEDVPLTRDTTTETRKDTGEGVSQSKASSSSQSELQAKLARRRNMNGEHNTPQKILPSTEPVHAAPVSKTEHVEQLDDSHGRERQASVSSERSSNVDEHILSDAAAANLTPAWLNSTSDTAAFDTHQNQDQNKKLSRIATESVADNCHEESPNAAAEEILPNAAMIETIAVLEIGLPCTAQEETTACAYGVESLAVETTDNIESQQATQQTFPSPAVEQLVPELPPDAQISLLVDIPGQGASSSDDAASREEKIELPPVPVSDAAVAGKVTISLALESPAAVSARDSSINPPPTDRGPGSRESPTPARVSWSPLRSSVAAIAAGVVPPASSSSSPSSSISSPRVAPQRANTTSTGGARSSNTSISPVRRTASLTGAPSPSASAKRSTWYPGKYLMEGLGSKHSTPRLKMNPELARKNYADLMSSSEKEFSSEKSSNSPRPFTSGSKESSVDRDFPVDDRSPTHMYGSSSPQQQEEALQAAAAESTDGVAAAVSVREDILDKMLELSRENGLLKKEVAMLRSEVQRQKALIALLSGENIDVLPPAAAATVSSDRNPETTEEHTEAQSGSRTTSTSNTEGAIAVGNNTSPGLSGAKARASKRFGARGFYSSYSSAEQEEGDGLFGADTDTTYGSSNNNYNLSKLALDDLGDGTGTDPQARKVSVDDAADSSSAAQSLDQLLNSGGSGSRNSKDGHPQQHHHIHHHYQKDSARALVGEKLLVQSFMSTSMVYPKPASQESEQQKGVWSERFGSLGLISSNAEVDDHLFNEENDRKAQQRAAATEAQNATMDYEEFLKKFMKTTELVNMTRDFISSVLGPNGDTTPPVGRKKLSYIFYGLHKLDVRCKDFFDQVEQSFARWPEFALESDERVICARDGVEQYVMQRIGEYAFKSVVDAEADTILSRRMKLLAFLKPEALDIKPDLFNETLLAVASDELRKINSYKTPGDKVACVVKSATVIFRSLSLSKAKSESNGPSAAGGGDDNNIAGADDFLPLFIWVVLRSNIPRLCSNFAYVDTFLNPARLMGKWGYCLINLCSAIEFVKFAESDQFVIDPREFDMRLLEAERELNGSFL